MARFKHLAFVCIFAWVTPTWAEETCAKTMARLSAKRDSAEISGWAAKQVERSAFFLWKNLSPEGTAPGAVVASPSRSNPDYWYHWVRDASLSYEPVLSFYLSSKAPEHRADSFRRLMDFARFSKGNQNAPTLSGLGEPKFYVDGTPFSQPWGRPQNDSQALRASLFVRFANGLLAEGREGEVRNQLYDRSKRSLIKADLESVAHHWRETCFDLWEEVNGQHFFTLMVQRKALLDGASLARRLGDPEAADFYEQEARAMRPVLESHWSGEKGYLEATKRFSGGLDYKDSGLDTAVLLGALKGDAGDGWMGASDDRVLATAFHLKRSFSGLYPVNHKGLFGTLIGRYPEDRYDGYQTDGNPPGNPWPLLTTAFSEMHYKAANTFRDRGEIRITEMNLAFFRDLAPNDSLSAGTTLRGEDPRFARLLEKLRFEGDSYLMRASYHAHKDWSQSEQINRDTGFMQGAPHLTWNYAAQLTALFERNR